MKACARKIRRAGRAVLWRGTRYECVGFGLRGTERLCGPRATRASHSPRLAFPGSQFRWPGICHVDVPVGLQAAAPHRLSPLPPLLRWGEGVARSPCYWPREPPDVGFSANDCRSRLGSSSHALARAVRASFGSLLKAIAPRCRQADAASRAALPCAVVLATTSARNTSRLLKSTSRWYSIPC